LGLRKQPDPQAVPVLIAALDDPDHLVSSLASDALADIGEPAVLPLLAVLEKGSLATRIEAVRALAKIADPRAIPALVEVMDEDSALMEHWAIAGLEKMGVGMMFYRP
jgi:HEAT repeat protein